MLNKYLFSQQPLVIDEETENTGNNLQTQDKASGSDDDNKIYPKGQIDAIKMHFLID